VSIWGEPAWFTHRLQRGAANPESPDVVEIGIAADGRIAHVMALAIQAKTICSKHWSAVVCQSRAMKKSLKTRPSI